MRSREKCGCVHDGHKWLVMCDEHRAEFNDTHERWAIEHVERDAANDAPVPDWLQNDPRDLALATAIVEAS